MGRGPYQPQRGSDMDYRMRYYNTLVGKMSTPTSINILPEHLVPAELYHVHVDSGDEEAPGDGKQSSVMTIFSIWNTTMGSSLMALPWGFAKSGLVGGILMSLSVGLISWYTCWLILKMAQQHNDLFDLCEEYLGSVGRWISFIAAILFGIGILISYDILMTTSLFESIESLRAFSTGSTHALKSVPYWNRYIAAAIIALVVFPLSSLRNFGILIKINTWSIIFLIYIIVFFLIVSIREGLGNLPQTALFNTQFGWLSGVLTASFVLHNAIINIMKKQRYPEHNVRDLTLGYSLVVATYLLVGSVCFAAFRKSEYAQKYGFPQDFLLIFSHTNIAALIAKFALIFQLLSSYPLLSTILRIQFFGMMWKSQFPGWLHVLTLNFVLVAAGTIFAMFLPQLASVLRFVGSTSGMVLVFALPSTMYWVKLYRERGRIPIIQTFTALLLCLIGIAMFVSQFV